MFEIDTRDVLSLITVTLCFASAFALYRAGLPGGVARILSQLIRLRDSLGIPESETEEIEAGLALG